jgi:pimeloyl-ACP methyl ester carboxylesterase
VTKTSLTVFFLLLLMVGFVQVDAQQMGSATISFEPYTLKTFDGKEQSAELGRLSVRENRTGRSNRLIQLAFVRLRSTAVQPGAPVIFLAGGPGVPGIGMGRIPVYFRLFERLRETSDVILLDQRGTGMSSPGLQCPARNVSAPSDVLASDLKIQQQLAKTIKSCAEDLRAKGIELAAYNINSVADDIDDLRQALGVDKVNLLGMSFGTQLALATVRRHGEHLERVVLAGTQGSDDNLILPNTFDLLLKKISLLVAQDIAINKSVPDFALLVETVLNQFDKNPVTLTITDRRTKQPVKVIVGKVALQVLLQGLSDERAVSSIPAFYYTISRGDYSLLTRSVEGLYNSLGGSGNSAMSVAMSCSGGYSSERFARVQREAQTSLVGNAINLQLIPGICKLVGDPDLGPEHRTRLWSTIPTLFLSGTLDGTTPPFQAEQVRWGFPNSVHLIVENAGHETLPFTRVQSIVLDFFKGQDVSDRTVSLPRPGFSSVEDAKKR